MKIEDKKKFSEKWVEYLQDQICDCYESIEKKFGGSQKFLATKWSKSKKSEGGGTYKILKNSILLRVKIIFTPENRLMIFPITLVVFIRIHLFYCGFILQQ